VEFNWEIKPLYNVIGVMKGTTYPDEWVIRGNHQDAWVNGAQDPISGLAALLAEAKAAGALAKNGLKPRRTVIYCAWDGEEAGLLGSTEWVEFYAAELKEKAVAYINSDGNGRGFFGAGGSPALQTLVTEVTDNVMDPQTNVSIRERKKSSDAVNENSVSGRKEILASNVFELHPLGSGSDYTPFLQHLVYLLSTLALEVRIMEVSIILSMIPMHCLSALRIRPWNMALLLRRSVVG
jgi:N-acetylated-alpha-linked acidic dipeptidase